MTLPSFLPNRRRAQNAQPKRCRLVLEALEDRCLMATRVWDGGAVSNNWTNASNWVGNVAPVAGDDLVFSGSASDKTADNNFADGTLFNSITLGGGYTLRGNRVRLGAGGIIDNSGTSDIISLQVTVGVGADSGLRTISIGAGSTLFMDDEIGGTMGILKAGAGNLSFRANNSYAGQTQVSAGGLFIERDEGLGTLGGNTIVRNGASLFLNDTQLGELRVDENLVLDAGARLRALEEVSHRGDIFLSGGTATIQHEAAIFTRDLEIHGVISGPGGLNVSSGRVLLRGDNTFQGSVSVSGFLRLGNIGGESLRSGLIVSNGGVVRLEQHDQIADDAPVSVLGSGELQLNGKNDTVGSLTMTGGRLRGYLMDPLDLLNYLNNGTIGGLAVNGLFRATSSSTVVQANADYCYIYLAAPDFVVRVDDGPALNDLIMGARFSGNVVKEGAGTLLIGTDVPGDGVYTVNAGLLRANAELRDTDVIVNASGVFAGDGKIRSLTVHAGGRVQPGSSSSATGILKLEGNLYLDPGAILQVKLNGTLAGSGHDQLDVEGSVTIDGAILEATLGPNTTTGQQFRIINNNLSDAVNGAFFIPPASMPFLLAAPSNQRLSINHGGGFLNNDVVVKREDTPPMAPDLALDRTEIDEGGVVTATGRLVDPDGGDRLRLLVNWGDGTQTQTFRPGLNPFSLRHRYRRPGQFTARFEWLDQNDLGNSREFTVAVNDVPGVGRTHSDLFFGSEFAALWSAFHPRRP